MKLKTSELILKILPAVLNPLTIELTLSEIEDKESERELNIKPPYFIKIRITPITRAMTKIIQSQDISGTLNNESKLDKNKKSKSKSQEKLSSNNDGSFKISDQSKGLIEGKSGKEKSGKSVEVGSIKSLKEGTGLPVGTIKAGSVT